jgi:UDP-glucose 4-epimerase
MAVLVTGGAGYIGSHMVHALLGAGERVAVLNTWQPALTEQSQPSLRSALPDQSSNVLFQRVLRKRDSPRAY